MPKEWKYDCKENLRNRFSLIMSIKKLNMIKTKNKLNSNRNMRKNLSSFGEIEI